MKSITQKQPHTVGVCEVCYVPQQGVSVEDVYTKNRLCLPTQWRCVKYTM
jgi:hypothetical protein